MRLILIAMILLCFQANTHAGVTDTIRVRSGTLNLKNLQHGDLSYLMYNKEAKDAEPQRITLVKFNIAHSEYHGKPAVIIKQEWHRDTTLHSCYTVFDARTFSTELHQTYWKRLGYSMSFDFETKRVEFTNANNSAPIPDSIKRTATLDFERSFAGYNLNWHADMILYQLLPYRENRTFLINYFDPGFGATEQVAYTVTGCETLNGRNGEKIACWVLNHYFDETAKEKGYERFWISKQTSEVLKLEDFGGVGHGYRYKLKLGISGDL